MDIDSMTVLTLLRSSMPAFEPERYERIFLSAIRATGVDTASRGPVRIPLSPKADSFHAMISGQDALDCHAYGPNTVNKLVEPNEAIAARFPDINRKLARPYAILGVEGSPPAGGQAEFRRIALAAADLIDDETFAILDFATCRLIPITPATADLLRSPDPHAAFADAIIVAKPWSADSRECDRVLSAIIKNGSIVDDHGHERFITWRLEPSMPHIDLARTIAATPAVRFKGLAFGAAIFFGSFVIVSAIGGRSLLRFDSLVSMLGALAGFTVIAAALAITLFLWRRNRHAARLAAMRACIARGRCPACWYDLSSGSPAEGAGLVRCPECAAMWRRTGAPARASVHSGRV